MPTDMNQYNEILISRTLMHLLTCEETRKSCIDVKYQRVFSFGHLRTLNFWLFFVDDCFYKNKYTVTLHLYVSGQILQNRVYGFTLQFGQNILDKFKPYIFTDSQICILIFLTHKIFLIFCWWIFHVLCTL
jgi:hypothetical protein